MPDMVVLTRCLASRHINHLAHARRPAASTLPARITRCLAQYSAIALLRRPGIPHPASATSSQRWLLAGHTAAGIVQLSATPDLKSAPDCGDPSRNSCLSGWRVGSVRGSKIVKTPIGSCVRKVPPERRETAIPKLRLILMNRSALGTFPKMPNRPTRSIGTPTKTRYLAVRRPARLDHSAPPHDRRQHPLWIQLATTFQRSFPSP
jgi:hypothetical protein